MEMISSLGTSGPALLSALANQSRPPANAEDPAHRAPATGEESHSRSRGHRHENSYQEPYLSYYKKEKNSLFIRTQEGDIVRLRFKQTVRAEANSSGTDTASLKASQRVRLSIVIKGDLSSEEQAAIAAVVEQASAIADTFFSGNLAGAFDAASALEIDGQQLARAALRLRSSESLTYSGFSPLAASTTTSDPSSLPASTDPASASPPTIPTTTGTDVPVQLPATSPDTPDGDAPATASSGSAEADSTVPPADAEPPAAMDPTAPAAPGNFLSAIFDFLTLLIDTFDDTTPSATDSAESSYAPAGLVQMSLKLRIFASLLVQTEAIPPADGESGTDGAADATRTSSNALPTLVGDTLDSLAAAHDPATAIIT